MSAALSSDYYTITIFCAPSGMGINLFCGSEIDGIPSWMPQQTQTGVVSAESVFPVFCN